MADKKMLQAEVNCIKRELPQTENPTATKKILLVFHQKPPLKIRRDIRLLNFRWSRKYYYWHAYLNKDRISKVKQVYKSIYKQNNN